MITTLQALEQIQTVLVCDGSFDGGPFTVAQLLLQGYGDVLNRHFILILNAIPVKVLPNIVADGADQVCACVVRQIRGILGQFDDIGETTVERGIVKELGFRIVQVIAHTFLDTDVLIRIIKVYLVAACIQLIEEVAAILAYGLLTDRFRIHGAVFVDLIQGHYSTGQRDTVGGSFFINFGGNTLGVVVILIVEYKAAQCTVNSHTSIPGHIIFSQMDDLGVHDLIVLTLYKGCVRVSTVGTGIVYSKCVLRCVTGMLINGCQIEFDYIVTLGQILEQIVAVLIVLRICQPGSVRHLIVDGVIIGIQLIQVDGHTVQTDLTFILNAILVVVDPHVVAQVDELHITGINGGVDLAFQYAVCIDRQRQGDRIGYTKLIDVGVNCSVLSGLTDGCGITVGNTEFDLILEVGITDVVGRIRRIEAFCILIQAGDHVVTGQFIEPVLTGGLICIGGLVNLPLSLAGGSSCGLTAVQSYGDISCGNIAFILNAVVIVVVECVVADRTGGDIQLCQNLIGGHTVNSGNRICVFSSNSSNRSRGGVTDELICICIHLLSSITGCTHLNDNTVFLAVLQAGAVSIYSFNTDGSYLTHIRRCCSGPTGPYSCCIRVACQHGKFCGRGLLTTVCCCPVTVCHILSDILCFDIVVNSSLNIIVSLRSNGYELNLLIYQIIRGQLELTGRNIGRTASDGTAAHCAELMGITVEGQNVDHTDTSCRFTAVNQCQLVEVVIAGLHNGHLSGFPICAVNTDVLTDQSGVCSGQFHMITASEVGQVTALNDIAQIHQSVIETGIETVSIVIAHDVTAIAVSLAVAHTGGILSGQRQLLCTADEAMGVNGKDTFRHTQRDVGGVFQLNRLTLRQDEILTKVENILLNGLALFVDFVNLLNLIRLQDCAVAQRCTDTVDAALFLGILCHIKRSIGRQVDGHDRVLQICGRCCGYSANGLKVDGTAGIVLIIGKSVDHFMRQFQSGQLLVVCGECDCCGITDRTGLMTCFTVCINGSILPVQHCCVLNLTYLRYIGIRGTLLKGDNHINVIGSEANICIDVINLEADSVCRERHALGAVAQVNRSHLLPGVRPGTVNLFSYLSKNFSGNKFCRISVSSTANRHCVHDVVIRIGI